MLIKKLKSCLYVRTAKQYEYISQPCALWRCGRLEVTSCSFMAIAFAAVAVAGCDRNGRGIAPSLNEIHPVFG